MRGWHGWDMNKEGSEAFHHRSINSNRSQTRTRRFVCPDSTHPPRSLPFDLINNSPRRLEPRTSLAQGWHNFLPPLGCPLFRVPEGTPVFRTRRPIGVKARTALHNCVPGRPRQQRLLLLWKKPVTWPSGASSVVVLLLHTLQSHAFPPFPPFYLSNIAPYSASLSSPRNTLCTPALVPSAR